MSVEPQRKKFKIARPDYTQFTPGSIVKIRLENFVIYKLTEFHLSPGLNMIIGPNGSGKSTFVCAVCLGLAGKPEFIGRAKKVEDFIRNNTQSCKIEISLKNNYTAVCNNAKLIKCIKVNDELIEIKRIIYKNYDSSSSSMNSSAIGASTSNKSKSEYYINNKACPEQLIKELVGVLNIQLDNLCQFLSQERVEEFAKLKNEKLLIETVRSIQPELIVNLESLQKSEIVKEEKSLILQNKSKVLDEALIKKNELQEKIEILQQYHEKIEKIDLFKKLIPIVRIKDFDNDKKKLKQDMKNVKIHYAELYKKVEPHQNKIALLESEHLVFKKKYNALVSKLNSLHTEHEKKISKYQEVLNNIQFNKKKIHFYKTRKEDYINKIQNREGNKLTLGKELTKYNIPDPSEFEKLHEAKKKLMLDRNHVDEEIDQLRNKRSILNTKISKEKQVINQRESSLQSDDTIHILDTQRFKREIKDAVLYLRSHEQEINSTILPPPIMSVSAANVNYASFLNAVVDRNVSTAFTITSDESYHAYSSMLLDQWGLNIRQLSKDPIREPPVSSAQLQQEWGFDGFLMDFVKGEEPVIKMLCEQNYIQLIPVSLRPLTHEIVEKLKNYKDSNGNLIFQKVIAGDTLYNFRQSRYGDRQIFYTSTNINKRNNLYQGNIISEDFKRKTMEFIQARTQNVNEYQNEAETLREEERAHASSIDSIKSELTRISEEEYRLKQEAQEHRKIQAKLLELDKEIAAFNDKLKQDASSKTKQLLQQTTELSQNLASINIELLQLDLKKNEVTLKLLDEKLRMFENKNKTCFAQDDLESFNTQLKEVESLYREKLEAYKEYKQNDSVNRWKSEIKSYSPDLLRKLKDLSDTCQEQDKFNAASIRDEIENLEEDIKNSNHDDSATNILESTEAKIHELESEIPQEEAALAKLTRVMTKQHNELLPQLQKIANDISVRFGILFKNVGSVGAVELDTSSSYNDWNLKIMVAFRDNSALKPLDSHTQSGGERAVSTVLYMIALQEFTTAPFRVVDEINQGMDANNERIIHRAMVENACAEKTSQYFLITPKLLTGLHYHPKMRIHCVMAGAWIPNPTEDPEKIHFGQTSNYVF